MSDVGEGRPCSICFHEFLLLMAVGLLDYCAECWHAAGEPSPPPSSRSEVAEREMRIRERMNRRGGEDRNRVRSGKA